MSERARRRRAPNGSAHGTAPEQPPAPRRDGASQRPADPRADLLGRGRARPRRRDRGRLGPEADASPAAGWARRRCCAGRCGWPRRWRWSRSPAAACRAARLPFEDPRVLARRVAAAAAGRRRCCAGRGAGDGVGARAARRRCSACCRRWRPFAIATSPPTTASSTRRSAPTSRARRTRPTVPKEHERCGSNLIAPAARVLGRRPADRRAAGRGPGPVAARGRRRSAGVSAAVELFALRRAQPRLAGRPRGPRRRARDPAPALDPRADRRAARGRRRGAGRDPASRGELAGRRSGAACRYRLGEALVPGSRCA